MKTLLSSFQTAIPQAKLLGDAEIFGVTTDSRRIQQGELFVALRGEHFDAHDFLEQVNKDEKAAAVVAEHVPPAFNLPALLVPNTKLALGDIARQWRQQFSMPIIGVTGSNGKTTVKEMIASIFSCHAESDAWLATSGNLNNEIGVPLTVLRLNAQHQCAVVEMGMNHPGEIAYLAS
ncbi:MAG: UDP-N-acetylmuramoyl-tripeptide--D-alanyl-D-alanine ligase, partial [Burkholderiaceae bacterium]|nr:UDP-N-acetylmuramoyl-tripeptide--D-alanyl-D-alanine ligase [Burkholderiaceae bacterium]